MPVEFTTLIPTLRMFDEARAREFYVEFLEFEVTFEHRFQPDFPLYMGIRKGPVHVHLSEHHGDGCPGMSLSIKMSGLDEYQQALLAKQYGYSRPGTPEKTEWGTREISIGDPFGNRITFFEDAPKEDAPKEDNA
ncbi:MAG: glyoxalase superfamily protein [Planctomycetota bacterium]|jgi:uncharacterized glyoxalase superfamily protein PhnB